MLCCNTYNCNIPLMVIVDDKLIIYRFYMFEYD